jgi:hypothetical protein
MQAYRDGTTVGAVISTNIMNEVVQHHIARRTMKCSSPTHPGTEMSIVEPGPYDVVADFSEVSNK